MTRIMAALTVLQGRQANKALRRALNHTGDKTFTAVKRTLAKQVGLTQRAVVAKGSLRKHRAGAALEYSIGSRGKAIPLKAFKARQGPKGVRASPWGRRRLFKSTFMVAAYGGHVFKRTSRKRLPIEKLYGPAIPKEMVKDATARAFEATVSTSLPARVAHEIRVLTKGVVS